MLPYLGAALLVAVLAKLAPRHSDLGEGAAQRRSAIRRWTRFATLAMCILQASFFVVVPLGRVESGDVIDPALADSVLFEAFLVLALTTGALIVLWISEQITERGVGNGAVLIVAAGILARLPTMLAQILLANEEGPSFQAMATLSVLFLLILVVVHCVTTAGPSAE